MSPTTKIFSLLKPSIFLRSQHSLLSPFHIPNLSPSPLLRFHRYSSSSASVLHTDTTNTTLTTGTTEDIFIHHPWPEWVRFVDRLSSKGYLKESSLAPAVTVADDGGDIRETRGGIDGDGVEYKDINLLKDGCLSFARDRFDIFKSLSKEDIQRVVEKGCPNLFRKAVNSAKRLRAYLHLDEGDVCSACNLRGSCDRAYVILKETEASARTVDIVRILLLYALDPLVISGAENPSSRGAIEASARKLILELIELSETSPDPELPKPAVKASQIKEKSLDSLVDDFSRDAEMKRGDWMCLKCNFMNFSRNIKCRKCGDGGPRRVGGDDVEMKKGDWVCHECSFMNFARNVRCLKCKAEGPKRVSADNVEMKKGDWNCSQCGFMNFASNTKCLRCRGPRPKRQLNPGEWECPSCDFLNFKGNMVCRKCNCERLKDVRSEDEDQPWRRPF
ncbi:unnamed protein product [Ilex paraguariensis]|uniref:RanBP2-type domain-containing protein n=1 Tax=Ilex paraguariensis TaxID=185542 RepID=A0ABC8UBU4_9AQUA